MESVRACGKKRPGLRVKRSRSAGKKAQVCGKKVSALREKSLSSAGKN
jgi:hypothetical protein